MVKTKILHIWRVKPRTRPLVQVFGAPQPHLLIPLTMLFLHNNYRIVFIAKNNKQNREDCSIQDIVLNSASNPTGLGAIRTLTGEWELTSTIKNENIKK